jgi:hypothetical protein
MEECIICFEEKQDFQFYSCGHKLCTHCYQKISNCPLCQSGKIEVVIIQPTTIVTSSRTTYNSLRCLVCIMLSTLIFLYFYNP